MENPKDNSITLTGKQRRFADCYLGEARFNATKAAILAGYSQKSAYEIGSQNLRKVEIRRYIDRRLSEMSLGANEVLARLTDITNVSIEDFLDENGLFDFKKAKKSGKMHLLKKFKYKGDVKVVKASPAESTDEQEQTEAATETTIIHQEVDLEVYSSHEALRDLGKHHKLFTDKVEHHNPDGTALAQPIADALLQFDQSVLKIYGTESEKDAD